MKEGACLQVLGIGIVLLSLWFLMTHVFHDSGVDRTAVPPSPSSGGSAAVDTLPADDSSAAVDARLSAQIAQTDSMSRKSAVASEYSGGSQPVDGGDAGSSPALGTFQLSNYEDSFLPTEAGLVEMTLEMWENEEFLALTQEEAHELLALDDTMGMKGPDSMLSIVGPLPTEEDCRVGFQDEKVQALLREVCAYEVELVERGAVPVARRKQSTAERIELLISLRDAAALSMMERLEKVTSCKTWRLWWRLYREWSR